LDLKFTNHPHSAGQKGAQTGAGQQAANSLQDTVAARQLQAQARALASRAHKWRKWVLGSPFSAGRSK